MPSIRLNKYLAQLGVASRRQIDAFISQNRILVNNLPATLGQKVDPDIDTLVVNKKIIPPHPQTLVYYLLHKPKFVLSTTHDDRGRDTVMNYVPSTPRVYPVGRLDYESTGLILLTNDGDLSLRLTHPRYHLPKTYLVTILGKVTIQKISQIQKGIILEDGLTAPTKVKIISQQLGHTTLEITLFQGKKRQIRRLCSTLHFHILDLHRIAIGPLQIHDLPSGKYRLLTSTEVRQMLN